MLLPGLKSHSLLTFGNCALLIVDITRFGTYVGAFFFNESGFFETSYQAAS